MLNGRSVLVTGGTGSFGRCFVETVLQRYRPRRLIVFSRDELKQHEMARRFSPAAYGCLRYFLGDVRDRERLYRAFDGVDVVVHAAALKQVPTCEYNPLEAIKTNVLGAANIIDAAIDRGVDRVIGLSTDKAANPVNLYGATKLCSDKLLVSANSYAGPHRTRFSVVRYGNVMGSRGSVVPLFLERRRRGVLPITDPRMTRFWITVEQGADFVLAVLQRMRGGEIFVPRLPSMNIVDLARAVAPDCRTETVGIRPGERLHETMISEDDARHTLQYDDYFAILPDPAMLHFSREPDPEGGRSCAEGFRYSSDTNDEWLSVEELRRMVGLMDVRDVA
ncbi:MAG: UDP-N-acetylglucosamine 4,6-dehydratase (inverting) [Pirellulales bacterium]|nr:UDP-N-acetylglucosamine 4,6-dehydratase (inverting) [Pirellulales bacterium]